VVDAEVRFVQSFNLLEQLYDNKKKRMKLWTKDESESTSPSATSELNEQDEDSSTFQIILCDNCDGEFYSDEAFTVSCVGETG
jgi:C4-type Zn-finger protein